MHGIVRPGTLRRRGTGNLGLQCDLPPGKIQHGRQNSPSGLLGLSDRVLRQHGGPWLRFLLGRLPSGSSGEHVLHADQGQLHQRSIAFVVSYSDTAGALAAVISARANADAGPISVSSNVSHTRRSTDGHGGSCSALVGVRLLGF